MDNLSQAKVARLRITVLRADTKKMLIYYKSSHNPNKWRVYESGFKTKEALRKSLDKTLEQHQNYVED